VAEITAEVLTMSEHPTASELQGLVHGELTRERAKAVVRHLLSGCDPCISQVAPYASILLDVVGLGRATGGALPQRSASDAGAVRARPAGAARPPRAAAEPDETLLGNAYDRAIDRAFAAVMRHGENAMRVGARAHQLVSRLSADEIAALRDLPPELRGYSGFEALVERSWAVRRDDPPSMVKLAELASAAAAGLADEGFSAGQVHDFQARAATELANAYRVMDRLGEAQITLDAARRHFRAGSQDRLLAARLLEVEANVHADRDELDAAFATLEAALRIYRRYGDPHFAGRCMIKKGLFSVLAGRHREATDALAEGLERIDPRQDPLLAVSAVHNTAFCLVESGRYREARALIWRHLALYNEHAGRQDRLKLRWLQAQIAAGLGDLARAERVWEEVRQGMREAGRPYHVAVTTGELAHLTLRRGDAPRARALALEAAQLFRGIDLKPQALAAMADLQADLERSSAQPAAELVEAVLRLLRDSAPDRQIGNLAARSA
jgi:tetratricopeptide (TPR) repeat protein